MDELVKITVNRLVDEPKSLWGEWTIKANFPGLPNKWMEIHHEGFNLLSSSKQRLAKALTDKYRLSSGLPSSRRRRSWS